MKCLDRAFALATGPHVCRSGYRGFLDHIRNMRENHAHDCLPLESGQNKVSRRYNQPELYPRTDSMIIEITQRNCARQESNQIKPIADWKVVAHRCTQHHDPRPMLGLAVHGTLDVELVLSGTKKDAGVLAQLFCCSLFRSAVEEWSFAAVVCNTELPFHALYHGV